MGLFDSLAGQVLGSLSGQGGQGSPSATELVGVVMQLLNNPQVGGLSGLVKAFEDKGLGQVIGSWVSTGQNLPISAAQIASVLGGGPLQELARQTGTSPDQQASVLSQVLPGLIDQLTPKGALPEAGTDLTAVLGNLAAGWLKR
jgi:uncharacterized protein YidB (DUF937 family)